MLCCCCRYFHDNAVNMSHTLYETCALLFFCLEWYVLVISYSQRQCAAFPVFSKLHLTFDPFEHLQLIIINVYTKWDLNHSFCGGEMPFLTPVGRNHLLAFILSASSKTPEQGNGCHALYVGSLQLQEMIYKWSDPHRKNYVYTYPF